MTSGFGAPAGLRGAPLEELSRAVDDRRREVAALLSTLGRSASELTAERARVRAALAEAEQARTLVLENRQEVRGEAVAGALRSSRDLYVRMRLLEARRAGIEERRQGLEAELAQLDQILEMAAQLEADPRLRSATAADPQVLCQRAQRQLLRLVAADHDAIAERIAGGPMDDLADIVLAVELVGRRLRRAPDLVVTGELVQCKQEAERALGRLRRLLYQISPQGLDRESLVAAVRRLAADLAGEVSVHIQVVGEERRVSSEVAMASFRVVVEAIDNACRHGHAAEVEVVLSFAPGRLNVVVADQGDGFDVAATEARLGHMRSLGLLGMRERVENAGGSFEVRSRPGAGAEVRVVFDTAWR